MEALMSVFASRVRELKQSLVFLDEHGMGHTTGDVEETAAKTKNKRTMEEQVLGSLWALDKSLAELEGKMDFVESKQEEEEAELETVRELVTAMQYHNDRAHDALTNVPSGVPNPPSKENAGAKSSGVLKPKQQQHHQQQQQQRGSAKAGKPSPVQLKPVTKQEFGTLNPAVRKRLSFDRLNEVVEGIQATLKATHKGKKQERHSFTHRDFTAHAGVSGRDLSRYMGALKRLNYIKETQNRGATTYTVC